MKVLKILFTLYLLVVPQLVIAESQPTKEQARHDSVVKLKDTLKKEQRSLAVKGGITNWSPASDDIDAQPNGLTMLKGLGICVGIFFIGIAITQRLRNRKGILKGQTRQMRVIERLQLTPKTALLLVECEGRPSFLCPKRGFSRRPMARREGPFARGARLYAHGC